MESDIVKNEIRDEIMKEILSRPSNKTCFDCGNMSPRWSSPYLGIFICMDCAGRHRSYGTHISYVKSVDLDFWKKNQLKSVELTGNNFMKKKFQEFGVPRIDSMFDYKSDIIFEIRKYIENIVKENLNENDYTIIKKKDINREKNDEKILNPIKFKVEKSLREEKNKIKKNKIKKLDVDFNFDNFNENDNLNEEEETHIDTKKISGMKISKKDKKKLAIEEKNKIKNQNIKKSCCQKIKEFIWNLFHVLNLYK